LAVNLPHGGVLVDRLLRRDPFELETGLTLTEEGRVPRLLPGQAIADLAGYKAVVVDETTLSDLAQIAMGAFSPLTGFMGEADYLSVVESMRLDSGLVWSLPVVLPLAEEVAQGLELDDEIILCDQDLRPRAYMTVASLYRPSLAADVVQIYGTADDAHPGVRSTLSRGPVYAGGPVTVLAMDDSPPFAQYTHTPALARTLFAERGWQTIVGFQTRNPIHRAHEYIQKCAMEIVDGLYVHPLIGPTKEDDVPGPLRMKAYEAILRHYYPEDRTLLGAYTAAMRYAGPREAIMHALVRKNFGCTHFIVGRDHAGVGSYYGTYAAQEIFTCFRPDEIGIIPVFFEHAFYCKRCAGMATTKTCPHAESERVTLSGTRVRAMLTQGIAPPPEFSRPEVVAVLMEHYAAYATS